MKKLKYSVDIMSVVSLFRLFLISSGEKFENIRGYKMNLPVCFRFHHVRMWNKVSRNVLNKSVDYDFIR